MNPILLIDDDEQLGPPLAMYFQRFELQLTQATRPSEGLALLRSRSFDAAILDVMLPEMDGFAVCRAIRRDSDIPIIMLTARGEVTDRVVGLELIPKGIYFIDYLPTDTRPADVAWIGLTALVLSILATIYPSWSASRINPAEALRYE